MTFGSTPSDMNAPPSTPLLVKPGQLLFRHWRGLSLAMKENPFLRNVTLIASGTGLGVAVVVLSSPLLSRLYSPDVFGTLAVYISLLSLPLVVSSARYELGIPLPDDDATAANLLALAFVLLLGTTTLLSLTTWILGARLVVWVNCPGLRPYLWLLPLGLFVSGLYQILGYWAVRMQAFPDLARGRVSQGTFTVAAQIGMGLVHDTPFGLVVGDMIGRFAAVLNLFRHPWHVQHAISLRGMVTVMKKYAKLPLLNASASLLTALKTQLPVIVLSRYFGADVAGLYALTTRVLGAPATLLGQAVGQVFFAEAASRKNREQELRQLTERVALCLFVIGLPVFCFVMRGGPELFTTVFGERWRDAGVYARFLAPWFLLWLTSSPLSNLFTIREWQGLVLLFSSLECAVLALALGIGTWLNSELGTIALLGCSGCCLSLVSIARFLRAGYASGLRVLRRAAPPAALAIASIILTGAIFTGPGLFLVALRLSVFLIVYGYFIWRLRLIHA